MQAAITEQIPAPPRQPADPLSVAQFALSLLGILVLGLGAFLLALLSLVQGVFDGWESALPLMLMAAGSGVSGLLLAPSAYYAFLRLQPARSQPRGLALRLPGISPGLLIFFWPLVLILGVLVVRLPAALTVFLLPPLHVLAIGLPVLWLFYLAARDLPLGSPQRRWGVFASGLVLGPLLILVAELVALVVFWILGVVVISSQPDLLAEIQDLAARLPYLQTDPEAVLEVVAPYLARPGVVLALLVFGAGLVPLIEEALKPVGVWLLAGRDLGPAAGFAAGVLSGAGYALFESLALTSAGEEWPFLVVARVGTGVIHILTTGLTGWALAVAWQKGRYLLLGGVYLLSVLIHGLWNGMTLAATLAEFNHQYGVTLPRGLDLAGAAGPYFLAGLALVSLVALVAVNRSLVRRDREAASPADLGEL